MNDMSAVVTQMMRPGMPTDMCSLFILSLIVASFMSMKGMGDSKL